MSTITLVVNYDIKISWKFSPQNVCHNEVVRAKFILKLVCNQIALEVTVDLLIL